MNDLVDRLARLPEDKRAALLRRLTTLTKEPVLGVRVPGTAAPASVQQQQLWFIDRIDQHRAANNLAYVWTLRGPLDIDALRAALTVVVDRHDSLRASFLPARPVELRVSSRFDGDLKLHDVSASPEPEAEFDAIAAACSEQHFDLDTPPLFDICLVRLAPQEHRLVWVVHHIVWDAASVGIFLRDLSSAYRARCAGLRPELPDLPIAYADYACWQSEWLAVKGGELAEWWREHLRGAPVTELPSDHPRPSTQTFGGRALEGELLPEQPLRALRGFCEEHRVTPYMAVLAMFAHLLGRWTRTEEVVVGSPFSIRPDARLENLVGFFVNMVPLRCPADAGDLLAQCLSVRDVVVDTMDRAALPFSDIVAAVNPPRDPSRTPLFQLEFAYESDAQSQTAVDFGATTLRHHKLHDGGSRFDLSLIVREGGDCLGYTLEYNPDLFDEVTMAALVAALGALMDSALANPRTALRNHGIVPGDQLARLRTLGAGGPAEAVAETVLETIVRQAAEDPERIAIRYRGTELSRGELVARARTVAARLGGAGVGSGDRVLLLARQSDAAVVGMLAAQLIGAAYVPLDVDAPPGRLRGIAERARATVCLLGREDEREVYWKTWPHQDGPLAVALWHAPDASGGAARAPESYPVFGETAYVIFTSGTTGTPKGVEIDHRALAHFCRAIGAAYRIGAGDTVLGFARPSFDVSVFEVFAGLTAGATLCIPDPETRRDPALLTAFLRAERVTVAELPPALLPHLDPDLPDLRLVSVGGEAFSGSLIEVWGRDGREFWNGYGPTETTVATTLKHCVEPTPGMPPIGRPLPGHRAHIVDEQLRPVPRGAIGELLIAGPGVARGYLADAAETARAFVGEPGTAGDRAYRTGDLVRWRGDGDLDFLGRADRQVKIRGFRVELAEVEQAIARHRAVRHAAAVVVDHPVLGRVLTAFAVSDDAELDSAAVLDRVRAELPDYAVPARLSLLADIPLTPNGKIDHRALAEIARSDAAPQPPSRDVRELTRTEREISDKIVGPALALTTPDPDATFFELGGNSLQAVQVVAALAAHFDITLTITEFFGAPTVQALARLIDGKERRSAVAQQRLRESMAAAEAMADEGAPS